MSKNVLLVKCDVGKAKPSTYNLPSQDFSYGKGYVKDKEGAKEVSMTWNFHQSTRDPQPQVDFKRKNIEKLQKNQQGKSSEKPPTDQKEPKPVFLDPNHTFGKKVKPSTPIGKLLANEFGEESEKVLNQIYEKQKEQKNAKKKTEVKVNNSELRKAKTGEEKSKENEKPKVFTLKKFQNVEPKTNTNKGRKQPVKSGKETNENEVKGNEEAKIVEKYFAENK